MFPSANRDTAFSTPQKPHLYVYHKHTAHGQITVSAFRYDEKGQLTPISKVNNIPEGKTANCGQGFCMSRDGKCIYNQLNGCNTICVLEENEAVGSVVIRQHAEIKGAKPRNRNLSPDGREGSRFPLVFPVRLRYIQFVMTVGCSRHSIRPLWKSASINIYQVYSPSAYDITDCG